MSGSWWDGAASELRHRVDVTAEQVGERYPLHADPGTGAWTTTRRGSWTGGFWAGLLGLRGRDEARTARDGLARWRDADTACRGLIFWYGSCGSPGGPELRAAAEALARDFDADLGAVPWGTAFGTDGDLLRVDSVAGLVPLLGWAGMPEVAREHLRSHLRWCFDGDVVQPSLTASHRGWIPADEPPRGSSRAHAWLLLGCVDGAHWLGEEFAEPAVSLARSWTARFGSGAPLADADLPDGPVDTSAAAITAVAFLKLAAATGQRSWWRDGSALLRRTVASALVRSGPARGALRDGCYDARSGLAPAAELVWGDFFCAAGLGLLAGDVQAGDV